MTAKQEQDTKNNGRWTKQEHEKFLMGMQLYGKDWRKIQTLIGSRNGAQIRSHAQKYFIKNKKQPENQEHHDHSQLNFDSPEHLQQHSSLGISMTEPQTNPDFSYYLNKIVQKDAFKQSFDFWDCLIDHKQVSQTDLPDAVKRKASFVSISSFQEDMLNPQPTKKVKRQ